ANIAGYSGSSGPSRAVGGTNVDDQFTRRGVIGLGVAGASAALAGGVGAAAIQSATLEAAPAGGRKLGYAVVGIGKLAQGQIIPALHATSSAYLAALVSGHP